MKKTIYQFWEGDSIPANVQHDLDELRQKAEAAGYTVELYNLQRIIDECGDHNLAEALKRMKRYLPISMFASACSDFLRYWVLQDEGIYMDTDVIITTDEFPEVPTEEGVFFCSEQTHRDKLNSCVSIVNGEQGKLYAKIMTALANQRLKETWLDSFEQCKANAKWLMEHKWSLISYLGPAYIRHYLPQPIMQGIKIERMPYELCSSHDPHSAIWHGGTGSWVEGGKGNPDNLLDKVRSGK